jgi:hypothetical protein
VFLQVRGLSVLRQQAHAASRAATGNGAYAGYGASASETQE